MQLIPAILRTGTRVCLALGIILALLVPWLVFTPVALGDATGEVPAVLDSAASDTFDVRGIVFEDIDNDGLFTSADRALSDVTVRLYQDSAPLGVWDTSDVWLGNQQSNASGTYSFMGLSSGQYHLVQMTPLGYACTTGEVISIELSGDRELEVSDVSFGNVYDEVYPPVLSHRLFLPSVVR